MYACMIHHINIMFVNIYISYGNIITFTSTPLNKYLQIYTNIYKLTNANI